MNSSSLLRDRMLTAALFAALIALGGLSTQCKMVNDAVTSVGAAQDANAGNCMAGCAHAFADSVHAESDLHKANVQACPDAACKAAEAARHDAAMTRIDAGRTACQNQCHSQGGGKGGR